MSSGRGQTNPIIPQTCWRHQTSLTRNTASASHDRISRSRLTYGPLQSGLLLPNSSCSHLLVDCHGKALWLRRKVNQGRPLLCPIRQLFRLIECGTSLGKAGLSGRGAHLCFAVREPLHRSRYGRNAVDLLNKTAIRSGRTGVLAHQVRIDIAAPVHSIRLGNNGVRGD